MNPRFILAPTLAFVSTIGLLTPTVYSQSPNPPYLREMPSEQRVLRDVKGADPIDTAARQAGAFEQLRNILYTLALADRRDRNHVLPDEQKIADYYAAASLRGWQRVQSALGQDRRRMFQLQGYATDPRLTSELLDQFFSPNFRALYAKADATFAQRHKEFVDNQRREMEQAKARQQTAATGTSDPGTLAMRRCVAAGRAPLQCAGEVFTSSLKTMAGGDAGMGSSFGKTLPTSLRMTGIYGDGHFFLSFTENTLWISCNQNTTQADYTVTMNDGQIQVATTPGREGAILGNKPFTLLMNSNGTLAGSGEVRIASVTPEPGQTAKNSQTVRRYISEQEAKNAPYWENPQRDIGGNPYVEEPISPSPAVGHKISTSTCKLGTVPPLSSTGPTYGAQSIALLTGSKTSEMFGGAPWEQRPANEKAWPGPGLRLHGVFEGEGGLSMEFHEDSAVVGCRQALSAKSYMVRPSNGQATVSINNDANPIMLTLGPDLGLSGSGSIRVNGHAFVGDRTDGGPMFASASDTCTIAALSPAK